MHRSRNCVAFVYRKLQISHKQLNLSHVSKSKTYPCFGSCAAGRVSGFRIQRRDAQAGICHVRRLECASITQLRHSAVARLPAASCRPGSRGPAAASVFGRCRSLPRVGGAPAVARYAQPLSTVAAPLSREVNIRDPQAGRFPNCRQTFWRRASPLAYIVVCLKRTAADAFRSVTVLHSWASIVRAQGKTATLCAIRYCHRHRPARVCIGDRSIFLRIRLGKMSDISETAARWVPHIERLN
jgi:hypothetical protein